MEHLQWSRDMIEPEVQDMMRVNGEHTGLTREGRRMDIDEYIDIIVE